MGVKAWGAIPDLWVITCSRCSFYLPFPGQRNSADEFAAQHEQTHEPATEPSDPFQGPDFMDEM